MSINELVTVTIIISTIIGFVSSKIILKACREAINENKDAVKEDFGVYCDVEAVWNESKFQEEPRSKRQS